MPVPVQPRKGKAPQPKRCPARETTLIQAHASPEPDSPNQVIEILDVKTGKKDPSFTSVAKLLAPKEHVEALKAVIEASAS